MLTKTEEIKEAKAVIKKLKQNVSYYEGQLEMWERELKRLEGKKK